MTTKKDSIGDVVDVIASYLLIALMGLGLPFLLEVDIGLKGTIGVFIVGGCVYGVITLFQRFVTPWFSRGIDRHRKGGGKVRVHLSTPIRAVLVIFCTGTLLAALIGSAINQFWVAMGVWLAITGGCSVIILGLVGIDRLIRWINAPDQRRQHEEALERRRRIPVRLELDPEERYQFAARNSLREKIRRTGHHRELRYRRERMVYCLHCGTCFSSINCLRCDANRLQHPLHKDTCSACQTSRREYVSSDGAYELTVCPLCSGTLGDSCPHCSGTLPIPTPLELRACKEHNNEVTTLFHSHSNEERCSWCTRLLPWIELRLAK